MKPKLLAILSALLLLTACVPPADPIAPTEPATEATEPATEPATTRETLPTEPPTQPPTQPPTELPTEPPTEPPTEAATAAETASQFFDSVDHPIHGQMGMTDTERQYTLSVSSRENDVLAGLLDDPRYQDICGGFGYRGDMMYIFSLDDAAVDSLVHDSLTSEDIPYELISTTVSINDLYKLFQEINANLEKYGAQQVAFQPRYNQIVAVVNDLGIIDADLRQLTDESKCIQIAATTFIPPPYTTDPSAPTELDG